MGRQRRAAPGIIPAYAGSTAALASQAHSIADHPRIRGEHGYLEVIVDPIQGSSPHTRGARRLRYGDRAGTRIIPAYAGSTSLATSRLPTKPDHPRIRGEHMTVRASSTPTGGSSPHTRGAHQCFTGYADGRRIIPAYAGSTHRHLQPVSIPEDHPRIRGEHPGPSSPCR